MLRSIGAVVAGLLAVIILSLGTDVVMHATKIFPPLGERMTDALFVLATAYRSVWSVLWPIIQGTNEFGRRLIEDVASNAGLQRENVPTEMSENELADLYVWLTRNYPHSEDPGVPRGYGSYDLTPRRLVARWRDSILTRLERRGTRQACENIRRIVLSFPELYWLKWRLRSAEEQTRRNTWDAIKPEEILKLAKDSSLGLVQSEEQLLRIVIGSLRELQKKLDDGAWHELWNEDPVRKPKHEGELVRKVESYLRETLESRGVIPNREVEVHPRGRSDIRIDAIKKLPNGDAYNRISLIIEAKGCWHERLKKAMQEQLVERYLIEDGCNYGLYLVGWFKCDEWNSSDWRKRRSPAWTLQMAQEFFEDQASRLSKEGKLIRAFVLNIPVSGRSPRKKRIVKRDLAMGYSPSADKTRSTRSG